MKLSRREALALGAGAVLYLTGCDEDEEGGGEARTTATGTTTGGDGCVLTPEQSEGPFYLPDAPLRREITEGRDGVPLEVRLKVQDAGSCEPIESATVEVWHCDALGEYSAGDDTFMRGAQRSDRAGEVGFATVYPGSYSGRTAHIHVKVHAGGDAVHTGQLYFDDETTDAVHERSPYGERGITNGEDGLYADGGRESTLTLEREGDGYVGRLTLGVRRA